MASVLVVFSTEMDIKTRHVTVLAEFMQRRLKSNSGQSAREATDFRNARLISSVIY
jgi:hypothetical protein